MFMGFMWRGLGSGNDPSDEWTDPGERISLWARSLEAASDQVAERYGDDHVIILYDEDDLR